MPTPNDFSRFEFGKQSSKDGEFGQAVPEETQYSQPGYAADMLPDSSTPRQFSQRDNSPVNVAGDADKDAFLELQQFLQNSLETPGCRVVNDCCGKIETDEQREGTRR
jgi:hypothetical protein